MHLMPTIDGGVSDISGARRRNAKLSEKELFVSIATGGNMVAPLSAPLYALDCSGCRISLISVSEQCEESSMRSQLL